VTFYLVSIVNLIPVCVRLILIVRHSFVHTLIHV